MFLFSHAIYRMFQCSNPREAKLEATKILINIGAGDASIDEPWNGRSFWT